MATASAFEELEERSIEWAKLRPDIRALLNVGSRARHNHLADLMSDLDLVIITTNPAYYLKDKSWFASFGEVQLTFLEETAVGGQFERRVLYRGGVDVDYAIFPSAVFRSIMEKGLSSEVLDVFRRGFRVLVDKDRLVEKLEIAPKQTTQPPTREEFSEHLNDFLYHAIWTAKKIHRGELWIAKMCCDGYLKISLLKTIEWHARANHDWDYDTWFNGRFLEIWADPQVLSELSQIFAHYDLNDIRKALNQTVLLHERLSRVIAEKLGYPFFQEEYSETFQQIENYLT